MSLSLFIDLEEELEYRRDDVYKQLGILLKKRTQYLNAPTKRAIQNHFANFNFGYNWVEDGEELLQKAKTERMIKAESKPMPYFYTDDNQDTNEVNYLAEFWEERLAIKRVINRDEDGLSRSTFHRAGLKRDKFALWVSREKPTRHKRIKLAKRQIAQQPVQP